MVPMHVLHVKHYHITISLCARYGMTKDDIRVYEERTRVFLETLKDGEPEPEPEPEPAADEGDVSVQIAS